MTLSQERWLYEYTSLLRCTCITCLVLNSSICPRCTFKLGNKHTTRTLFINGSCQMFRNVLSDIIVKTGIVTIFLSVAFKIFCLFKYLHSGHNAKKMPFAVAFYEN
jgi:hypothetical protein